VTLLASSIGSLVVSGDALGLTPSNGPRHVIERAVNGGVEADLSYFVMSPYDYANFRVSIVDAGNVLLTQFVCPQNPSRCFPGNSPARSIRFVRLTPGNTPEEIVVDYFTGGADCCYASLVFVPTGSGYRELTQIWGRGGYSLADLRKDGSFEFVSGDGGFTCAFTDCADSPTPIEIWQLQGGTLIDVTRSYPTLVAADAAKLWALYISARKDPSRSVRGILAAWAGDESRLGRWNQALAAIRTAEALGYLDQGALAGWMSPSAANYPTALARFLSRAGYPA
jgi:hypothetical protein